MSTTLECKDTGIRKSEFVTKTQFLYIHKYVLIELISKSYLSWDIHYLLQIYPFRQNLYNMNS